MSQTNCEVRPPPNTHKSKQQAALRRVATCTVSNTTDRAVFKQKRSAKVVARQSSSKAQRARATCNLGCQIENCLNNCQLNGSFQSSVGPASDVRMRPERSGTSTSSPAARCVSRVVFLRVPLVRWGLKGTFWDGPKNNKGWTNALEMGSRNQGRLGFVCNQGSAETGGFGCHSPSLQDGF